MNAIGIRDVGSWDVATRVYVLDLFDITMSGSSQAQKKAAEDVAAATAVLT